MIFELNGDNGLLLRALSIAQTSGQKIGLTSGSFDLIHPYHFQFFIRCRRNCDLLVVGVDSDDLVRERKGPSRPILPDTQRVVMVDALKPVALAFVMNMVEDFGAAAKLIRPDFIFKNDAFDGKEQEILGRESAARTMIIRDVIDRSSTTDIVRAAKACS